MASAKNVEKKAASSKTKTSASRKTKSLKESKNSLISKGELKEKILSILDKEFDTTPDEVSDKVFYETLSRIVVELMQEKHRKFSNKTVHQSSCIFVCNKFSNPSKII